MTDEQRAQLATAAERLHGAADTESRVEILQEFTGVCHPDVVRLVQLAQGDAEAEVRRAALDLLDGYDSADIIPVAMRAMSDPDKEVRLAAIAALRAVMDARVGEALLRGLDDPDEDVRQAAVLALGEKAYAVQAPLIETTLKSGHADMKSEVLYLLKEAKSHAAMDLLLTGLNDPAPEFRDEVNDAIYFLISQRFTSYTQAARWWGQNRDKYDDELIEKEGVEIPPP